MDDSKEGPKQDSNEDSKEVDSTNAPDHLDEMKKNKISKTATKRKKKIVQNSKPELPHLELLTIKKEIVEDDVADFTNKENEAHKPKNMKNILQNSKEDEENPNKKKDDPKKGKMKNSVQNSKKSISKNSDDNISDKENHQVLQTKLQKKSIVQDPKEDSKKEENASSTKKMTANHSCNVCHETFANQKDMKRHFRKNHLSVKCFGES